MTPSPATVSHTPWRDRLRQQQQALRQRFVQDGATAAVLRQQCLLVDNVLSELWHETRMPRDICLIAAGGYGRRELYPHSDIDLLILLPDNHDETHAAQLEQLVGLLWDIGLAVGHSVRTLAECVEEAAKDVTVRTNLLEMRLLVGAQTRFQHLAKVLHNSMDGQSFLKAKVEEQAHRHARFNDTAYNLEPNLKESPGGLRDLHNVLWIARGLGISGWNGLVGAGLLTSNEKRQIRRHELLLQNLRIRLHYLANRREDRLLFDFQSALAQQLGFSDNTKRRASEQLMQHYYHSARFISLMNEILLQSLHEFAFPKSAPVQKLTPHFSARNGLLEANSPTLLQREPGAIFEAFLVLQKHPELSGMSMGLIRNLGRVKKLVNNEFRSQPKNKLQFMEMLRQPSGITTTLRRMHRYGILGRYLPLFGRITGQMQHDLFHVYTVDEHTLNVLRNLRRFTLPERAHEFPLCSQLIENFPHKEVLYLAALFHDIAKGRGGDHSSLGAKDAHKFCKTHGLSKEDSDLVAWLVSSHLLMSSTAQKCDLSDAAVIEAFAEKAGSEKRLTALYLLTVADIRGTSPDVWNAWKSRLLESLFHATRRQLRGNGMSNAAELQDRQQQARIILSRYAIMTPAYEVLWEKLGDNYFLRHESQEIAWHTRLLLTHINAPKPIVRARLSPGGEGIQVMIYTADRADLFARICGFFERMRYTIVEAKVHTTLHGYALDSFLVLDGSDTSVRYRDLLSYIEYELTQLLESRLPVDAPLQGRISRQLKHFPIKPIITIDSADHGNIHALSIVAGDRPGLLSQIAHLLLQHGVSLHTAKINTLGNRAEDTFQISALNNTQLTENTLEKLRGGLAEVL